jgi:hypothetical protein
MAHLESVRALIRAVSSHEREIMRMSDENVFTLEYLVSQMVERVVPPSGAVLMIADRDEGVDVNEMEVVSPAVHAVSPEAVEEAPATGAAPLAEEVETSVTPAASSKKSKKSAKKLTIQTTTGREQILEALNANIQAEVVPAEAVEPAAVEDEEVTVETTVEAGATAEEVEGSEEVFSTPASKAKKSKHAAKSGAKSALKSGKKGAVEASGVGDTADRRVSFSRPLSMVKIISPLSTGNSMGKYFTAPNTPQTAAGVDSSSSSAAKSGKKSGSKKRLWTEDDA